MSRSVATLVAPILTLVVTACAMPTTQLGSISADALYAEQLKQQQLAIEWDLKQQQRVEDVGYALLAAAAPFCTGALVPKSGLRFANAHSFAREYQPAARALGFSDTVVVVGVAAGSAAQRAGFAAGDRVTALDNGVPPVGPSALQSLARQLQTRRVPGTSLTLERGSFGFLSASATSEDTTLVGPTRASAMLRTVVPSDTVCGYNLLAARKDDLNAWADGTNVTVTSAMMRFVADDDELAAVLAHEIAHNAMRHIQAQQKNTALGGLFGAIIDIAAATQGVNTQGEFTKHGMNVGSIVFSQDFEREADYVGMYLLARAGRSIKHAPNLWRRMAQENPGSIKYASTHPTTAERFVRLEQAAREIEEKIARGDELRPEMRNAPPAARSPSRALASSTRTTSPASAAPSAPRPATPKPAASPAPAAQSVKVEPTRPTPSTHESPGSVEAASNTAVSSYTTLELSDSVSYTFGPAAPRNGLTIPQARRRAVRAYQDGLEALEVRLYEQAETKYREAVLHDGGEARYHAALGALLLKRGKVTAAQAALSAAVLLDTENAEYRRLLAEARSR